MKRKKKYIDCLSNETTNKLFERYKNKYEKEYQKYINNIKYCYDIIKLHIHYGHHLMDANIHQPT